jgi:TolB protein
MGSAALAATAIALTGAATAQATYPGANGQIAYSRIDDSEYHIRAHLYLANPDGTNERMVSQPTGQTMMGDPAFSADGSLLTYEAMGRFGYGSTIVANGDGSGAQRLPGEGKDPVLSPDGTRIAYRHEANISTDPNGPGLYVRNADGSDPSFLGHFTMPDWSPDGGTIVAPETIADGGSQPAPGADLFAISPAGGTPQQLTDTAVVESYPSWSPDGRKLAYVVERDTGKAEIWVMNADGSNQHFVRDGYRPVWSPDGSKLLFEATGDDFDFGLWLMDADGSDARMVVEEAFGAAWQPMPGAPVNRAPTCNDVRVTPRVLSPANGKLRPVRLLGGSDPDGDRVRVEVAWVGQDEPVRGRGDRTSPDARWTHDPRVALLRAERASRGDGRVYSIDFWVTDGHGARCGGTVKVGVPRHRNRPAIESPFYASSVLLPGESKRAAKQRRDRLHARG